MLPCYAHRLDATWHVSFARSVHYSAASFRFRAVWSVELSPDVTPVATDLAEFQVQAGGGDRIHAEPESQRLSVGKKFLGIVRITK